jgi:hypothetical protein
MKQNFFYKFIYSQKDKNSFIMHEVLDSFNDKELIREDNEHLIFSVLFSKLDALSNSISRTEFEYNDKLVSCCASLSYVAVYDITFRVYNLVRSNLIIGHKIKPLMEKELKRQEALALGQQMLDNPENFGLV